MFKVSNNPTFTHTVPINTPEDGGFREETLDVCFNVLDYKTLEEIEPGFDIAKRRPYCDAIVNCIKGGAVDHEGKSLPMTPELHGHLMGLTYVQEGIMKAYTKAMLGMKTKN